MRLILPLVRRRAVFFNLGSGHKSIAFIFVFVFETTTYHGALESDRFNVVRSALLLC